MPTSVASGPRTTSARGAAGPPHRERLAGWCWAVAAAVGVVVLYRTCVLSSLGQRIDDQLMRRLAALLSPSTGWAERLLEQITVTSCVATTAVIVLLAAAAGRGRHAIGATTSTAAVVATAELLKTVLVRPDHLAGAVTNSFPSGHVAAVAGLLAAAVVATPRRRRQWTLLLGLPVLVATGLAVVVTEWHRPSDVLAAALLGLSACGATTALCDRET